MRLCFATNNQNKIKEVNALLGNDFSLLSLSDIGCNEDLAEDQPTLAGNAQQKAAYIYNNYKIDCFADDTGLLVDALGGEPGVYSARYAGPQRSNKDNINLLLSNLKGIDNRKAAFITSICLILNGKEYFFEGKVSGGILHSPSGAEGFGYDPIFRPIGYDTSFAEMSLEEKNKISHRSLAVQQLINFLKTNFH